jgi:hypothetical protein
MIHGVIKPLISVSINKDITRLFISDGSLLINIGIPFFVVKGTRGWKRHRLDETHLRGIVTICFEVFAELKPWKYISEEESTVRNENDVTSRSSLAIPSCDKGVKKQVKMALSTARP